MLSGPVVTLPREGVGPRSARCMKIVEVPLGGVARSRAELAVDIVIFGIVHGVERIPIEFFRSREEVAVAESLTGEETLRAAEAVLESLAKVTKSPRVRAGALLMAYYLHHPPAPAVVLVAASRGRIRRPRERRARRSTRSRASPDDPEPAHLAARPPPEPPGRSS